MSSITGFGEGLISGKVGSLSEILWDLTRFYNWSIVSYNYLAYHVWKEYQKPCHWASVFWDLTKV